MEYRKLGDTAIALSAITYGAFAIGGTMWGGNEKKDSIASIQAALDHGMTTIDTAPFYGFGLSEELIGEAIQGRQRDQIQLLTKFGLVWDGSHQGKGEFFFDADHNGKAVPVYKLSSKASIIRELEDSLRRLRTDYIDLLQLHWPDATTPVDETMEALNVLIEQGKIRAAGVSNYNVEQLKAAESLITLSSNQVPYSMLNRSIEEDIIPYAQQHNQSIIAYSPLERGLLSGKYFADAKLKSDDHRNGYFGQFNLDKVSALINVLQPIAAAKNVKTAQLVLRWTSLQPGITVVLAGSRNAQQAIENAQAMDLNISAEEMQLISSALEENFNS